MRPPFRTPLAAVVVSIALLVAMSPAVAAATSRFTFSLTLRGHVPPGIGFDLGLSPGVGGSNVFCVAPGDPLDSVVPLCESGHTYKTVVTLAPGESIEYSLTLYHPTTLRVLWSGSLTGDGRNHRREYTVDFDLPATDAASLTSASPASPMPPSPIPFLILAWLVGFAISVVTPRTRGRPARS